MPLVPSWRSRVSGYDPDSLWYSGQFVSNQTSVPFSRRGARYHSGYSAMDDFVPGYYDKLEYRPVRHSKLVYIHLAGLREWRETQSANSGIFVPDEGTLFPVGPQARDMVYFLPDGEVSQLCRTAFNAVSQQFPTEVSLPNLLLELGDVTSIFNLARSNLLETASSGYLSWEFGIRPLLADLRALSRALDTVRTRLEYLKRTYGKSTRVGYSYKGTVASQKRTFVVVNSMTISFERPERFPYLFQFNGRLFHRLDWLWDAEAELRGLVGTLGFDNPLLVAWEALPFSFVVDWVVNLGSYLDRLKAQDKTGQWDISNAHWSVKVTAPFDGYQTANVLGGVVKHHCVSGIATSYTRGFGLPVDAIDVSTLTPHQATLLAALLAAN